MRRVFVDIIDLQGDLPWIMGGKPGSQRDRLIVFRQNSSAQNTFIPCHCRKANFFTGITNDTVCQGCFGEPRSQSPQVVFQLLKGLVNRSSGRVFSIRPPWLLTNSSSQPINSMKMGSVFSSAVYRCQSPVTGMSRGGLP